MPGPDGPLYRLDGLEFDIDRNLTLSEVFSYSLVNQQSNTVARVYYSVPDDEPFESRAWILANKPSIEAVIAHTGHLEAKNITGAQPVMDLIWHHTRLHCLRTDDGNTLDLDAVPRRFDQPMQATGFINRVLTTRPSAPFEVTGELMRYESPLRPEYWLLPEMATP